MSKFQSKKIFKKIFFYENHIFFISIGTPVTDARFMSF